MLVPGNLLYVNERICGLIDSVDFQTDEEGFTQYAAYGCELKGILGYRILGTTIGLIDNDNAPSVESWMRMLTCANCTENPRIPGATQERKLISHVETADDNYGTDTIGTPNLSTYFNAGENLLEDLSELCVNYDTNRKLQLGFDVVCKNAQSTWFHVLEGEDHTSTSDDPIIISRDFENVAQLDFTRSMRDRVNVVYAEGEEEFMVKTAGDTKHKGIARRELYQDLSTDVTREVTMPDGTKRTLSDAQYRNALVTKANTFTQADIHCLEGQIINRNALPDYSLLGAMVTVIDREYGVTANDWISEINFIDEEGDIEVNYTVGTDIQAKYLTEVK